MINRMIIRMRNPENPEQDAEDKNDKYKKKNVLAPNPTFAHAHIL